MGMGSLFLRYDSPDGTHMGPTFVSGATILSVRIGLFAISSGFDQKNMLVIGPFFSSRSIFVPYGTLCAHPASLTNIYVLLIAGRKPIWMRY
jgi:hypothetical protein